MAKRRGFSFGSRGLSSVFRRKPVPQPETRAWTLTEHNTAAVLKIANGLGVGADPNGILNDLVATAVMSSQVSRLQSLFGPLLLGQAKQSPPPDAPATEATADAPAESSEGDPPPRASDSSSEP